MVHGLWSSLYVCTPSFNMKIVILGNERQKEEWLSKPQAGGVLLRWVSNERELLDETADAYFNLLYQANDNNLDAYSHLTVPLFLNEVIYPFKLNKGTSTPVFRLNAWPGFLKREIIEVAAADKNKIHLAGNILSQLGWKYKSVPDIPGLITARVIATVINEAYFTLEQEVSTKNEIDIAMKLGTNYPYGPFEWSEIIGLQKIYQLLIEMSRSDGRYVPAQLLIKEAEQQVAWP